MPSCVPNWLNYARGHVLHFVKFTHAQRLKATQDVAGFAIEAIANVIIDKALLGQPLPAGGTGAAVTFAHLKRFRSKKLHDYRHALETSDGVDIRWKIFDGHPFRIAAPKEVELLQIADTTASALLRAIEPDRYGNTEPRYLEELTPKLYRRNQGDVISYGLKTFPPAASRLGGPLAFLSDL